VESLYQSIGNGVGPGNTQVIGVKVENADTQFEFMANVVVTEDCGRS
jgi:hypothetical protein